jgi:hypothetical protein
MTTIKTVDHPHNVILRHSSPCVKYTITDRATYLNGQIPCVETDAAIGLMASALLLFENRAARIAGRPLELDTVAELIGWEVCDVCGHLQCFCGG